MEKTVLALVLICLCSAVFADSDSTGIISGTTERLEFSFTNSTGFRDSQANCTLLMYDSVNTAVLNIPKMSSYGDGRFYYDWVQSALPGYYPVYVNCTNYAKENATLGGGVFVVPRPFEKAVAHGDAVYSGRYVELASSPPEFDFLGFGPWLLVVVILVVGALIYSNMGKK
jgi:hypothetical protein